MHTNTNKLIKYKILKMYPSFIINLLFYFVGSGLFPIRKHKLLMFCRPTAKANNSKQINRLNNSEAQASQALRHSPPKSAQQSAVKALFWMTRFEARLIINF